MSDLREYMTTDEFAELDSDAHHAVWRAHAENRIDAIPVSGKQPDAMRLYNRAQVTELLYQLADPS